jgi:hypothetical protein
MSSATRTRKRRVLREVLACPDCRSDVRIRRFAPTGVSRVEVLHDDTCPTWLAAGGQPFRQISVARLT